MMSQSKFAWNTALSLAMNVTLRAAGTLTFIAIARLGKTQDAGTFSLALGYLAILTTVFVSLDDLLIRESIRDSGQLRSILFTYGVIRFILTIGTWLALVLVLGASRIYASNDMVALVILSSSIIIDAFSMIGQAVLNAQGYYASPLVAVVCGAVVKFLGAVLAILAHQDLPAVTLAWPLGSALTAMIMIRSLAIHLRQSPGLSMFRFDRNLGNRLMRLFPSFAMAGILAGLEYQIDVILLSILLSNEVVAQYSAAVTVMMVFQMLSQAYRLVLYPAIVRSLKNGAVATRRLVLRSLVLMGGLAFLIAAIITPLAFPLIDLVFGSRLMVVSGTILQILIWNLVFMFLSVPLVRCLVAMDGQAMVWRIMVASLTTNLVANIFLIPPLGPIGCAYARLISSALFCLLMGWAVSRKLGSENFQNVLAF